MEAISKLLGHDVSTSSHVVTSDRSIRRSGHRIHALRDRGLGSSETSRSQTLGGNDDIKALGIVESDVTRARASDVFKGQVNIGSEARTSSASVHHPRRRRSLAKTTSEHNINGTTHLEQPQFVNEASYLSCITPGKNEGTFELPFNASIAIPEDCFGKKDTLTCRVATPHRRWQMCPGHLCPRERIHSQIFSFSSSLPQLKKNVTICLPFNPVVSLDYQEITVRVKWTSHIEWNTATFHIKELDQRQFVEMELSKLGTFVVTARPKTETFQVAMQGCLYQARLSRHISVRFPKKAVSQEISCTIQIIPIHTGSVDQGKEQQPADLTSVTRVSEFVDIVPNLETVFSRPVTVKLPLPGTSDSGESPFSHYSQQDTAVLQKTGSDWQLIETPYRFSRTSVSVDVKHLSRFCVIHCVPGRQKKMQEAVGILEGKSETEKGDMCLFLSIRNKTWVCLVEVFPKEKAAAGISRRFQQGFTIVTRTRTLPAGAAPFRAASRRTLLATKNTPLVDIDAGLDIYEGLTWLIHVSGDVRVTGKSDLWENSELRYFAELGESFRTFYLEPHDSDPRPLEAQVNLVPVSLSDESQRDKLTLTFKFNIDESTMVEFLAPDSPLAPLTEEAVLEKISEIKEDPAPVSRKEETVRPPSSAPPLREVPAKVVRRLTTSKKHISAHKESKALTGRSLMTLSRLVPEGLTLAVHLHLPDSTITGIGFDALSNHLHTSLVSYKILLYWKRSCKDKQMGAVQQLADALKSMNYHGLAEALLQCHLQNREFTLHSLSQPRDRLLETLVPP